MDQKVKKRIVISMLVLVLLTLTILGFTYAYFRTRIVGNAKEKSINTVTKKLEIVYGDGSGVIAPSSSIAPGWSATKTFTVENTSNETVSYSIMFDNMTNTFTRNEDWTYVLSKGGSEVASGTIVAGDHQILVAQITTLANTTDEYSLTVTYANLVGVNQSEDMGKTLKLRVNIADVANTWDNATEGTLLYAIKNDPLNEVVEPLTKPGTTPSGVISYTESVGTTVYTGNNYDYLSTLYFTYSDSYTFDSKTGTFTLVNPKKDLYKNIYSELPGKYVAVMGEYTDTGDSVGLSTIYKMIAATNDINAQSSYSYSIIKSVIDTTITEKLVSSTIDDYGTSYYFRGSVNNNFVNYSGMCWRIVRVQGDGTIKLILFDEDYECQNIPSNRTDGAFINDGATYTYSGETTYLYGGEVEDLLDDWASQKITNSSGDVVREKNLDPTYLATTTWCEDTAVTYSYTFGYNANWDYGNGEDYVIYDQTLNGHWYTHEYYGAYSRLNNRGMASPSLECNTNGLKSGDKKTSTNKFLNSIGLITADEAAFAGLANTSSYTRENYLYENATKSYFTMSPIAFEPDFSGPRQWAITNLGSLSYLYPYNAYTMRPAIVLASYATITGGNGLKGSPYIIG